MNEKKFNVGGTAYIMNLIECAVNNGSRTAVVNGNWIIDSEVRLPSNFTLILENCHLRMADGVYSNLFVNEHHGTEIGRTSDGTDRNISILGRGEAILDGGEYNGLSESTQLQNGLPPIWKNNLLLFTNVKGFRVSGISCRNQRWWALNFVYCSHGYIGNIDFRACDVCVDKNGNLYHGLSWKKYSEILVKNADGIDLRQGCHDIEIEHITGFTEDDTIALTGLNGRLEQAFAVDSLSSDICRIKIKDVRTASLCSMVRLLNQGGVCLYDVVIEDIYDASAESTCVDRGVYTIRIGDTYLYGARQTTASETHHITVRNVYSRGEYAIATAGEIGALIIYGIECADGCQMFWHGEKQR